MPHFPLFKITSQKGLQNANVCTFIKLPLLHYIQYVIYSLWDLLKVPLFIWEKLICLLLFKRCFVSHMHTEVTESLANGQNISVPTFIMAMIWYSRILRKIARSFLIPPSPLHYHDIQLYLAVTLEGLLEIFVS